MELLSQKPHKPAEKEKCFLLSAKGWVQVYIIHTACNREDAESWEDFCWHQAGVVGVSQCPAPRICLLFSWVSACCSSEEERRGSWGLLLHCLFLRVEEKEQVVATCSELPESYSDNNWGPEQSLPTSSDWKQLKSSFISMQCWMQLKRSVIPTLNTAVLTSRLCALLLWSCCFRNSLYILGEGGNWEVCRERKGNWSI